MKKYEYIDENRKDQEQQTSDPYNNSEISNENSLRNEMLEELNRLKELILKNPDKKLNNLNDKERKIFNKFIKRFAYCPVCGNYNHYYNLKTLYFDEDLKDYKEFLVEHMRRDISSRKLKKYNIHIGVLCCSCYKKLYEK